jgi:hypothetical protein
VVILFLFKTYNLNEKFELSNQNQIKHHQYNKNNKDNTNDKDNNNNKDDGIYNHFYQQVMNPYKYPMTMFFSNDSKEMPKSNSKLF